MFSTVLFLRCFFAVVFAVLFLYTALILPDFLSVGKYYLYKKTAPLCEAVKYRD